MGIILPAKGNPLAIEVHQALVGDGDAMGVTRHIAQHLLGATERLLGVDDPIGVAQRRQIRGERVRVGEACVIAKELQAPGLVRGEELLQTQSPE